LHSKNTLRSQKNFCRFQKFGSVKQIKATFNCEAIFFAQLKPFVFLCQLCPFAWKNSLKEKINSENADERSPDAECNRDRLSPQKLHKVQKLVPKKSPTLQRGM
jgi:hypothetical protein